MPASPASSSPSAARTFLRAKSRAPFMKPLVTRSVRSQRPRPTPSHVANLKRILRLGRLRLRGPEWSQGRVPISRHPKSEETGEAHPPSGADPRHMRRRGPALPRRQPPLTHIAAASREGFSTKRANSRSCLDVYGPRAIATGLANSGPRVATADVYPASLCGLSDHRREPRWIFARFPLNDAKALAETMPVQTPGSGSDGVTVSPSSANRCNC